MGSDVVTLIMNDHRVLEHLFEQLQAGEGDRRALVDEISARLLAHARAEEQAVYPAAARARPEEREEVEHGVNEHQEAEELLNQVRETIDSPRFETVLQEFVNAVEHHVREEEHEVLPTLRDTLDEPTLSELGEAFERVRCELLGHEGFAEAGARTEAGQEGFAEAGAQSEAGNQTKAELYQRAKAVDIPGRSRMSKDELSKALRKAT